MRQFAAFYANINSRNAKKCGGRIPATSRLSLVKTGAITAYSLPPEKSRFFLKQIDQGFLNCLNWLIKPFVEES